jgi:hypothetical protein
MPDIDFKKVAALFRLREVKIWEAYLSSYLVKAYKKSAKWSNQELNDVTTMFRTRQKSIHFNQALSIK